MATETINHSDPTHGTYEDGTCDLCDYCPVCDAVTEYNHETCTVCGRVWGIDY